MRNKWCLTAAFCAATAFAGAATIIYQENFDGPAGVNLNGRAPAIAPPGVTWVAGADFKANGQVIWDTVAWGDAAYLPFSAKPGYIYELSTTIVVTAGAVVNDWIALGFTEFNTVPGSRFFNDNGERNPRYWMMSRTASATQNDQTFVGPGTGGGQNSTTISADNLKIVLNTTAPIWTVAWYFNNILARTVDVAEADKTLLNYLAMSNSRASGTISNFKLTAIPFVAWGPSPADGASALLPDVTLSWNKGRDPNNIEAPNPRIVSHVLRYVTQSIDAPVTEPNFLHPQAVAIAVADSADPVTYPEITFGPDTRVFWRVDHVLSIGGPIIGNVWQFSTLRSAPLINDGEPADVGVFAGQDAEFEASFYSYSAATPTWKKYVDGVNDLVIADNPWFTIDPDKYAVESDMSSYAKLVVKDAQLADEGLYYLTLNSTGGQAVSRPAALQINRQLSHYPFNNSFEDLLGGPTGIPASTDPNHPTVEFTTDARVGSHAVVLYSPPAVATRGQYIDLGTEAYPKAGVGNGLETGTISMWIKPAKVGNLILMSNFNDNVTINEASVGTTGFSFSMPSATQTRMVVRGEPIDNTYYEMGTVQAGSVNLVASGRWHHVVTTWKAGSHIDLYLDGVLVSSVGGGTPEQFLAWQRGVLLGAGRTSEDRAVLTNFYSGGIDDLRVFNYAKDKYGVADLYYEVTGERSCIDEYADAFDFNNDCVVNIEDFAEFAAEWLSSGLYPQ